MGIESVSLVIAAFVAVSTGIAALMRHRSFSFILFFLFGLALFVHEALCLIETFGDSGRFVHPRLHSLSILLLGPLALGFLGQLVPTQRRWMDRGLWGVVGVAVSLVAAMGVFPSSAERPWYWVASHLLLLFPVGIWIYGLALGAKTSQLKRERLRLRVVFFGAVVTLLFSMMDGLRFFGYSVFPLGTFARVLYLLLVFQLFIKRELLTLQEAVGKLALFGSVSAILSAIYLVLVSWVGDKDLFYFNTFIASFVIIMLFEPIRRLTERFTRKLFLGRAAVLEQELVRLSSDILGIVEPAVLAKRIETALKKCLLVESSSLYLLDRDGLSYVPACDSGAPQAKEIRRSSPLVEYMTLRRGRPFILESLENDRESFLGARARNFFAACLDSLRSMEADLVIPFLHGNRIEGFCAVSTGEKTVVSHEELRRFSTVSRQVAQSLRNVQGFVRVRERDKLATVGELAAGLAHEIKNPLGAIKGATELLHPGTDGETQREFLSVIRDETDRLSAVVTDFLDYAKPRRDYQDLKCDPLSILEHTIKLIQKDGAVAVARQDPAQAIWVKADPEQLKQVLLNLLLNAKESVEPPRVAKIEVLTQVLHPKRPVFPLSESMPLYKMWEGWQTLRESHPNEIVEIEIRDNGMGIDPRDHTRIFEPFFTTKRTGTGLGLAICRRLIESMGGSLQVRENQPAGTIFVLHLPSYQEGLRSLEASLESPEGVGGGFSPASEQRRRDGDAQPL